MHPIDIGAALANFMNKIAGNTDIILTFGCGCCDCNPVTVGFEASSVTACEGLGLSELAEMKSSGVGVEMETGISKHFA